VLGSGPFCQGFFRLIFGLIFVSNGYLGIILNISNQILRRNLPDLGPNLGGFLLILAVANISCAPAGSVNEEDACCLY